MIHPGVPPAALADAIDRLLPQTQCSRCGYPGCRPYAQALAAGEADVNRCPPGGQAGIEKLARLLRRAAKPLDPECGIEKPLHLARIEEPDCIGCTLCIQACPVDAIVGAAKLMHTVLAELCTGCELCLPPCPVDCIAMVPAPAAAAQWTPQRADAARRRHEARSARLAREAAEATEHGAGARTTQEAEARRAAVQAAVERARAAREQAGGTRPRSVE
jgi:electron transport complex protein RnfB